MRYNISMSQLIIASDEVGRGALAGPIVAAAIIARGFYKEKQILAKVKDSKLLTARRRQELFLLITRHFDWSIQMLSNKYIDRHGIQSANVRVMEKAILKLGPENRNKAIKIIADYVGGAWRYQSNDLKINFFKHGDSIYPEIAAASIVAKVYRDKLMGQWDKKYPDYDFGRHKGYGTRGHLDKIKLFGFCPLHRRSFLRGLDR